MTSSSPAGSPLTPEETPGVSEILGYFAGAAQLMAGRAEGLRRLDLSADGFWTSFFAIVVALPPTAMSWVEYEGIERGNKATAASGPVVVYLVHALADAIGWVLPVLILMSVARWIGFGRKIVPLVVATNWGGALIAWAMVPIELLLILTGGSEASVAVAILASFASLFLTIRLISTAIGRDLPMAVAIGVLMLLSSLVTYALVTDLTGIALV